MLIDWAIFIQVFKAATEFPPSAAMVKIKELKELASLENGFIIICLFCRIRSHDYWSINLLAKERSTKSYLQVLWIFCIIILIILCAYYLLKLLWRCYSLVLASNNIYMLIDTYISYITYDNTYMCTLIISTLILKGLEACNTYIKGLVYT